jgi:predicted metal-dependent hydrolase
MFQQLGGGYQGLANPSRCECHECTQARWKMSLQGQMQGQWQGAIPLTSQGLPNEVRNPSLGDTK